MSRAPNDHERERFARVEALFGAALEEPPDQRHAWLAAACENDPALLAEVRELLALDALDTPGHLRSPAEKLQVDDELADGAIIAGRYRVGARIGSGGLGVVHLAEQLEPVRRSVALKVGRRGLDDAAALALFQAESRALSMVSHPGIAQVYDVGRTASGRFYVAMELVDGVPLTDFCARHALDLGSRLRLFIDICRAVQHAHQRGVIHRDLKPSNVLVTRHGDVAWPKVIDFGVAHATGAESSEPLEPIAGTPAYMSPEQARGSGGARDVDTRSDVYSLGVMLYELLTGTLPFESPAKVTRDLPTLRDVMRGPLEPPSSRVTRQPLPSGTPRSVQPVDRRSLRWGLDAVVAKAMAHDRAARYATVSELAADIDRTLHHLPVSARAHTAAYVVGSFVRRHRILVAAVAVLLVSAVSVGVLMASLASDRAEQRRIAEREAAGAQAQREIADRTSQLAERLSARNLLMAAAVALDAGDAGTTRTNLDAIDEAHRGWEWRYFYLEADRSEVTFAVPPLERPPPVARDPLAPNSTPRRAPITALAIAAAAPRLAAADGAGRVHLWSLEVEPAAITSPSDRPTQGVAQTISSHDTAVAGLAMSPDGRLIATSDLARSLRVWDVASGARLWERQGVVSLGRGAFSPDGSRLAFGAFGDHAVSVYDALRGDLLDRFPIAVPTAYRPTWVGGGALLVTDLSRTMRLDLETRAVVWLRPARLIEPAGPERFVARMLPNYVSWGLFDATTGDMLRPLGDPESLVENMDVSPDASWTATAGVTALGLFEDGALVARSGPGHEAERAEPRPRDPAGARALPGHDGAITAVIFSPGGDHVFTGDSTGVVKGWNTSTLPQPFTVPRSNDVIFAGAATADGKVVVTGGWGAVKAWDAVLGTERWTRLVGRAYVSALAPDARGEVVAVGDWRGVARILDLASGEERRRVELGAARIFALAWAPEGRLIVGREDGRMEVLDVTTGVVLRSVAGHGSPIRALALSADGGYLASGSGDGAVWPVINEERPDEGADASVRLWRWPGLEPVVELPGHLASVRSLAFAPDSARLVSGGSDRTLRTWSVPEGRLLAERVGVGHEVTAVAFTADGSRLVTAHGEGPLLIWDTGGFDLLATLSGGHGHVLWAGFSSDGRSLVAVSRQRAVVRFETERDPARSVGRAEVRAARALVDAEAGAPSADEIARRIEARSDIPKAVQQRALDLVRARGDHALMLNSFAWGRVLTPGQGEQGLAEALQASTTATKARPDDWGIWGTLALARYRMNDFEGALAAADSCVAIQRLSGPHNDPVGDLVRVMILSRLGRIGEARALFESSRPALQGEDLRLDHEAWSLFAEAEAALREAGSIPVDPLTP